MEVGTAIGLSALSSAYGAHTANASAGRMRQGTMDYMTADTRQKQEYQIRMENTKHQRNIADLQSAGLNPILSATSGMGSAVGTPGGTAQPGMYDVKRAVGPEVVASAVALGRMKQEIKTLKSQERLNDESAWREQDLAKYYAQQRQMLRAQQTSEELRWPGIRAESDIARDTQAGTAVEAAIDRSPQGEWNRAIRRWIPMLNSGAAASRSLRR